VPENLVRRGKTGVYHVRLQLNGRELWRSTGHTTLKSAQRKAEEIKVQLRNERDWQRPGREMTFGEWVDHYLSHISPKKKTGGRDKERLEAALKLWRYRALPDVLPSHVERYLNLQRARLRPATVNLERAITQAVFEAAVKDGLLERNPFKGIAREEATPRVRTLTPENEAKLRPFLRLERQRWLTMMLGTGLRIQEACFLEWEDLDWGRRLLRVKEEGAKWGRSREVPIFPHVEQVVREQYEERGRLWNSIPHTYAKALGRASQRAGIPWLSPHDLRHSFATRYLQGGGDIYVLSKIMGHRSVQVTEQTYAHLVSEDLVERSKAVRWPATASAPVDEKAESALDNTPSA